jgi:hypothetical protein
MTARKAVGADGFGAYSVMSMLAACAVKHKNFDGGNRPQRVLNDEKETWIFIQFRRSVDSDDVHSGRMWR